MSILSSAPWHWFFGKVHTKGDFLLLATFGEKELTSVSVNEGES